MGPFDEFGLVTKKGRDGTAELKKQGASKPQALICLLFPLSNLATFCFGEVWMFVLGLFVGRPIGLLL